MFNERQFDQISDIALSAAVVAAVGVIGFIGLLAPALARLFGARTLGARLVWSPVFGAILLCIADQATALLFATSEIPTGAATAVIGAPLLFVLARRLPKTPPGEDTSINANASDWGFRAAAVLVVLLLLVIGFTLSFGRGPAGWSWSFGPELEALLQWRAPRVADRVIDRLHGFERSRKPG